MECRYITGDYDYLIKVIIRNRKELQRFVVERLTSAPGLGRIQTRLVLSEVNSTAGMPVD